MASYIKQTGIDFIAKSKDEKYEIELFVDEGIIAKSSYDGIINLSDASDEQKEKFAEGVESFFSSLPSTFKLLEDPIYEMFTANDVLYSEGAISYSYGSAKCVYDFYFTVVNEKCIGIQCTYVTEGKEIDSSSIYGVFDEIARTIKWEEKEQSVVPAETDAEAGTDTSEKVVEKKVSLWERISNLKIPLWVFWILIAAILLWKVIPAKKGEWHEDAMSLDNTKGLLGLFAILVVLHHLVQRIGADNAGSLGVLENMGVCFVGGFLFFSGYGLFYSFKNKPDYLQGFLKKRLPTILVPFFACIIVYMLSSIAAGAKYEGIGIVKYLTGWSLNAMNSDISQMW